MHKFIFPSQDAFLSSKSSQILKNYGLDEILEVESSSESIKVSITSISQQVDSNDIEIGSVSAFYGTITGSATGSGYINPTGSVYGSGNQYITSSHC